MQWLTVSFHNAMIPLCSCSAASHIHITFKMTVHNIAHTLSCHRPAHTMCKLEPHTVTVPHLHTTHAATARCTQGLMVHDPEPTPSCAHMA
jgi:hypothetical protein